MITIPTVILSGLAAAAIFFLVLPIAAVISIIGLLIFGGIIVIGGPLVLGGSALFLGIPALLVAVYVFFGNFFGSPGIAEILPGAGALLSQAFSFLPF